MDSNFIYYHNRNCNANFLGFFMPKEFLVAFPRMWQSMSSNNVVNYKREREFVACLAPNNTNNLEPSKLSVKSPCLQALV
jgi:hypothetical protein